MLLKSRSDGRVMLPAVVVVVVLAAVLAGCGSGPSSSGLSSSSSVSRPASVTRSVGFVVGGTVTSAMIAWDSGAGMKSEGVVGVPWKRTASIAPGTKIMLGAMAETSGTVLCGIAVEGMTVTTESAVGNGETAVCAWIVK